MSFNRAQICTVASAAILATLSVPSIVSAHDSTSNETVVYMTRHAEKLTVQTEAGLDNCALDKKGKMRCEEALNKLGETRADLLADWFAANGIAENITHIMSSDKQRTRQTVEPTAAMLRTMGHELNDSEDGIDDGVVQLPATAANAEGNELTSNSKSVKPMVEAIMALPAGSVAVVAAHSGTIYSILGGSDTDGNPATGDDDFSGLGIDTTISNDQDLASLFPKKESDGKVPTFGDLWKVTIDTDTGEATVVWRKNLQMQNLQVMNETVNSKVSM